MSIFEPAFKFMLPHEGGYAFDPNDPGGRTKFGISQRTHPGLDIVNLTMADAEAIYRRDFWEKYGLGRIDNQDVANKVFDLAVNMGPAPAIKILQCALCFVGQSVVADGIFGADSLQAVNKNPAGLLTAMRDGARRHYLNLANHNPSLSRYLTGWMARAGA